MNKVELKNYEGSYTAIKVFHVFGVLVIVVGIVIALMGAASGNLATSRFGSSGASAFAALTGALPGAGIAIAGVFNVVFAKMAEANVHTAEMTQEILRQAVARRDDGGPGRKDIPVVTPKPVNGKTAEVKPAAPKKPRPIGGDNPSMSEGELLETHKGVDIYRRTEGIFIGSQWYPGLTAAKTAIDKAKSDATSGHN
jgi:hypothetical protein